MNPQRDEYAVRLLHGMGALIRADGPDLTARGLSILMLVQSTEGPHTVRGLAAKLETSKPSVTRTLDRLEELGLVKRIDDPADRRSVLVKLLPGGAKHVALFVRAAKVA